MLHFYSWYKQLTQKSSMLSLGCWGPTWATPGCEHHCWQQEKTAAPMPLAADRGHWTAHCGLPASSSTARASFSSSMPSKSDLQIKTTTLEVLQRPHTNLEAVQWEGSEREMKDFNQHWEKYNFESVTAAISWPWYWMPERETGAQILNVCQTPTLENKSLETEQGW